MAPGMPCLGGCAPRQCLSALRERRPDGPARYAHLRLRLGESAPGGVRGRRRLLIHPGGLAGRLLGRRRFLLSRASGELLGHRHFLRGRLVSLHEAGGQESREVEKVASEEKQLGKSIVGAPGQDASHRRLVGDGGQARRGHQEEVAGLQVVAGDVGPELLGQAQRGLGTFVLRRDCR